MKFTYREFANDMARAAFTTDFSVDSKGSDVIAYKGAKFKVNKADNSSISYTIISGFDKAVTFQVSRLLSMLRFCTFCINAHVYAA